MIKANYKHPKTEVKKVWAGAYGGHYDIIVFFKSKPRKGTSNKGEYDCYDNKNIIVGDMPLCDFQRLYPNADISNYVEEGRPKDIEIIEVFQLYPEAVWDEYGIIEDFRTHNDW